MNIQSNSGLGRSALVTVASGAALQLQGGISTTYVNPLTLRGTGVTGSANGALESVSGNNTFSGLITLGANTSIGSDTAGNTLTINNAGTITGAGYNLTLVGAGNGIIDSAIGTTTGSMTMNGSGQWTLAGANTYTGATTINSGTLSLTGTLNGSSVSNNGAVLLKAARDQSAAQ